MENSLVGLFYWINPCVTHYPLLTLLYLVPFKTGAFVPGKPVKPVAIR
jgi:hypothetical protein